MIASRAALLGATILLGTAAHAGEAQVATRHSMHAAEVRPAPGPATGRFAAVARFSPSPEGGSRKPGRYSLRAKLAAGTPGSCADELFAHGFESP